MTSIRRNGIKCDKCKHEHKFCSNCGYEMHPDTDFSQWLRSLDYPLDGSQCSNQNLDYIWFSFYQNWFITIEEKTNGKGYSDSKSDLSQIQSHGLIRQMLSSASGNTFDISFGNKKRNEKVEYRGHYLIQFEKTTPKNSKWIKINEDECTSLELVYLLRYGKLIKITPFENIIQLSEQLNISFADAVSLLNLSRS